MYESEAEDVFFPVLLSCEAWTKCCEFVKRQDTDRCSLISKITD